MNDGRMIADGPTTEIKGLVGSHRIRATLAGVSTIDLEQLPGVSSAELRGDAVSLTCLDSDAAMRALLLRHPEARDIEVAGAGLEEAFLELTQRSNGIEPTLVLEVTR